MPCEVDDSYNFVSEKVKIYYCTKCLNHYVKIGGDIISTVIKET